MGKRSVVVILSLILLVIGNHSYSQCWNRLGNDIDGSSLYSGSGLALDSTGNVVVMGSYTFGSSFEGQTKVYWYNGANWIQKGQDINGAANDLSGFSVDLSSDGNVLVIGAPGVNGNGKVRVFEWSGTSWIQKGSTIIGEALGDEFGTAVSINSSGSIIAVGGMKNNDAGFESGHVRLFEWNGSSWGQLGLDIDGENVDDRFGWRVALNSSGTILVAGSKYNDGNGVDAGHVRAYEWNGVSWQQKGADIDGEAGGDTFGTSLSINGDGTQFVAGAIWNDGNGADAGHARVYSWDGANWNQKGTDIDGENADDYFGSSVSISYSGDTMAIGGMQNDGIGSDAGHTRVFAWDGVAWVQIGNEIEGEASGDWSGSRVKLSSDGATIAIGAIQNDGNGNNMGHVRVFESSNAVDTIAPYAPSISYTITGFCINSMSATAFDNCAGLVQGVPDVSFPLYDLDTTVVTWEFDDGNGNVSYSNQTVVIYPIDTSVIVTNDSVLSSPLSPAGYFFQWLDCDNAYVPIFGETSNQLNVSQNGNYALEITTSAGCIDTSACISVATIGIEEQALENELTLYPNPSLHGLINIDFMGQIESVVVMDLAGRRLSFLSKPDEKIIDVNNLSSGKYVVHIETSTGSVVRKFFVIAQ